MIKASMKKETQQQQITMTMKVFLKNLSLAIPSLTKLRIKMNPTT